MKEVDVRAWLRKSWGGKSPRLTWIEPRSGSTAGAPDVLVPIGERLAPVELKVGAFREGRLAVKVRPEQYAWHYDCLAGGVRSYFLVGLSSKQYIFCTSSWLVAAEEEPQGYVEIGVQNPSRLMVIKALELIDKKSSLLVRCNR